MVFIDTHAHIYTQEFLSDIHSVMISAQQAGVEKIVLPSIDMQHFHLMEQLVTEYPGRVFPLMGIHPCSIRENFEKEMELVKHELKQNKYVGIGETGIDLYWDVTYLSQQKTAFEIQLNFAVEFDLPIVIHQRNSFKEIFEVLDKPEFRDVKGVFHCYAGDLDTAYRCIDMGFYLGIGGVVTYKNSLMPEVVKHIPLENLLLETDSPYLPPAPYRGKRNEPAYIPVIAQKIADIRDCDVEEVAAVTTFNTNKLFGI
jgi:TatD DNase family protein